MTAVSLRLGDHSYDVIIGPGVRTALADVIRRLRAERDDEHDKTLGTMAPRSTNGARL